MSNIGEPRRIVIAEPLHAPASPPIPEQDESTPIVEPVPATPAPEKIPAGV